MKLCDYGCGREAKYQFKNGKWCCEKNVHSCPKIREQNSISHKGKQPWNKGKTNIYSEDSIEKMSEAKKGIIISEEIKKKMSEAKKGTVCSEETKRKISVSNKGKKHNIESKKKMSKSSKGKQPWNKGMLNCFSKETIKKMKSSLKGREVWNKFGINKIKEKYPFFSKIEEMRYNPDKPKEIQVHCKTHNCPNSKEQGGWFTPTREQLFDRIKALEKPCGFGEANFYCSDECKQECPLFNLKSDPNDYIKILYTSEKYQIFRQEVLKRDDYKCIYCGEKAEHVHHTRPQKLEPFFSLDPDFGISTGNLANKIC